MKSLIEKVSIVLMILAIVFQSFGPVVASANSEEANSNEEKLYQATEEIVTEAGITLYKDTFMYGVDSEEEGFTQVQVGDTFVNVSKESLLEVDSSEDQIPLFYDANQLESAEVQNFTKDQVLYGLYPNEEPRIQLTEDMELPVYQNEFELQVVYIGNTAFYLNELDRESALDSLEALLSEDATEESEKEEVEVIEDESEVVAEEEAVVDSEEEVQNEETTTETEEAEAGTLFSASLDEEKARVLSTLANPWKGSSAKYFKTNVDNLTVYSQGNTKKLGKLTKGQVYSIDANYGNWHQIQFGNVKGYVYKADTLPDNGTSLKNINKYYKHSSQHVVALQDVTVYDNSSGELVEFAKINHGERYPIVSDYGKNWSRIIYADRVGYVLNSEVRHEFTGGEKHFTVLASNLPVYDNRSGSLKQVGSLTKGQAYEIVSDYGNWHRIQYNNHYGYVSKAHTEPSDGAYIRNKNTNFTHSDRSFTASQNAIVYDNTGGTLRGFGTIQKGQSYYIASDYGNWWRIIFADRVGYIQKSKVGFNFFNTDNFFKPIAGNLPVYDNSTGKLVQIGALKKGQVYPRVGNYGANWHRIQFGDGYGFVYTTGTELGDPYHIKNLNSEYSHTNDKILTDKKVEVMDNSSGKLVPFATLDSSVIYPIASDYGNWWRIIVTGRVGYVLKSDVSNYGIKETNYDLTLNEALEIQMRVNPQTDKEYKTYVSKEFIDKSNRVSVDSLNVRGGPGTSFWVVGRLSKGNAVEIINEVDGWYEIKYTENHQWVNASPNDAKYYLDPLNFVNDVRQKFQFLDLARSSDASASALNKYLNGKGILNNQGQAFLDASLTHGVNDIYLVSHASLETNHGKSQLATGVEVGKDAQGKLVLVTTANRNSLKDIRTTYNMYGIGAVDSNSLRGGAFHAYNEGWFTPRQAIIGGAGFIGNDYIKAGQNTLYKMRWNPAAMDLRNAATHQYATDIGWAAKQVTTMYNLYQQLDSYTLYLDIPVYKAR